MHFVYTVYLCGVPHDSDNEEPKFPSRNHLLVFLMQAHCVVYEVGTNLYACNAGKICFKRVKDVSLQNDP